MCWYKNGVDRFGNENIKIHCMIPNCVKDREARIRDGNEDIKSKDAKDVANSNSLEGG